MVSTPNCIQENMFAKDAKITRDLWQKADNLAKDDNIFVRHLGSTAFGAAGVITNLGNTFMYAGSAPFTLAANIINLRFCQAITQLLSDLFNAARCLVMTVISVAAVALGFFAPRLVYDVMRPVDLPATLEEVNRRLNHENASKDQTITNLQQQIPGLEEQISGLEGRRAQLEGERTQLQTDLNNLQAQQSDESAVDQEGAQEDLQAQIQRKDAEIEELNGVITQLRAEVSEVGAQPQIDSLTAELREAREQIRVLEGLKEAFVVRDAALRDQINNLEEVKGILNAANSQNSQHIENLEAQLEAQGRETEGLHPLQQEKRALESKIEYLKEELRTSGDSRQVLERGTARSVREKRELSQKLTEAQEQIAGLEERIQRHKEAADVLKAVPVSSKEEAYARLENEKARLETVIVNLQAELAALKQEQADKKAHEAQAKAKNERDIAELEKDIEKLENELVDDAALSEHSPRKNLSDERVAELEVALEEQKAILVQQQAELLKLRQAEEAAAVLKAVPFSSKEEAYARLENEKARLETVVEDLQAALAALKQEQANKKAHEAQAKAKNERDIAELEKEIAELENDLVGDAALSGSNPVVHAAIGAAAELPEGALNAEQAQALQQQVNALSAQLEETKKLSQQWEEGAAAIVALAHNDVSEEVLEEMGKQLRQIRRERLPSPK